MEIWISISKKAFDEKNYKRILDYPISGIRINMSRESFDWAKKYIKLLSESGFPLEKIYLDIGNNKPRINLNGNNFLEVLAGNHIKIAEKTLTDNVYSVTQLDFFDKLKINDCIIFGDGEFEFVYITKNNNDYILEAKSDCTIRNNMSLYIKGGKTFHFGLLPNETNKVNEILSSYRISLIVSFVEEQANIKFCHNIFPLAKSIIPKIETDSAILKLEEILSISNTIIIARGDLGLTMGIEKIGILQDNILSKAIEYGADTIIATEVLESLSKRNIPYRSEIIDITNSYLKGAKGILLTSETASSNEPFICIDYLHKVITYLINSKYHE